MNTTVTIRHPSYRSNYEHMLVFIKPCSDPLKLNILILDFFFILAILHLPIFWGILQSDLRTSQETS